MSAEKLNQSIDSWLQALEHYDFSQLCTQPAIGHWSIGQLYQHLIDDTHFYLEQIIPCVASNEHSNENASVTAREMFLANDFPDEQIEGAPSNAFIPQPDSKQELSTGFIQLKEEVERIGKMVRESPFAGKTKHPGLGYFSALEWLQFAEMHFRHHLRQKKRIDTFLATIER